MTDIDHSAAGPLVHTDFCRSAPRLAMLQLLKLKVCGVSLINNVAKRR